MKFLIVILLLMALGCSRKNLTAKKQVYYSKGNSVTDGSQLGSMGLFIIKYDSTKYYPIPETYKPSHVSKAEVLECEIVLIKYINEYNIDTKLVYKKSRKKYPKAKYTLNEFQIDLKGSGRQYVAAISPAGKRMVFVYSFCDPKEMGINDTGLVVVHDGGNCYFDYKIDLESMKIFDFSVNGIA